MIHRRAFILLWAALVAGSPFVFSQPSAGTMAFTVTMPQPANHLFHVTFRCDGLQGEMQDVKMPVWTPGFYGIGDYANFVSNFHAEDAAGHSLQLEKVTKNTWRVVTANATSVTLNYDVLGPRSFAASNFLGENRAYISTTGLFVYLAGQLQHPLTVAIKLPPNWTQVATGLDPVPGQPNTFSAANFDVLYDSPLLLGNQEIQRFDVKGIPHTVAIENVPPAVDRPKMLADLKKMVETATQLMGDIPYKHYTFLMMGTGNGGIEHTNSASIAFNGNSLTTERGYQGWLSYVSHEYFHHFNVKRIRPIALGPFDYDKENLTNMLWVSEGLTVYYQDIVMVRAGLMTRDTYLEKMKNAINRFENSPGRRYQSATDSSMNTWNSGSGVGGDRNVTISYYDNGAMLGAMLDLKIRNESNNRKSMDDVMRALYHKYYQEKKRGFTDAEFRAECESAAGGDLTEVFEYASTTKDVDYAKYFAYAGLQTNVTSQEAPGSYLGANFQTKEGKLTISCVTPDSPAQTAGLTAQDQVLEVEGTKATAKVLNDLLAAKKPGDTIKVKISRNNAPQDLDVVLGKNFKRAFNIQPVSNPTPLQGAILKDWMRGVQ